MPKTLNIAHRGARSLAPENTLLAAEKGLACGADLWELDVARSADGVLFLLHDDSLARTTNAAEQFPDRGPCLAHDFTWAELSQLEAGSYFARHDRFGTIADGTLAPADMAQFDQLRLPTLAEALAFTRDTAWRVNIEIKDLSETPGHNQIVSEVLAVIDRYQLADQVVISSFQHDYLRQVRNIRSDIALGVLVEAPPENPAQLLAKLDAQSFNPALEHITPAQVAAWQAEGIPVWVYTVNNEDQLQALRSVGVSGLFTDYPQRLAGL